MGIQNFNKSFKELILLSGLPRQLRWLAMTFVSCMSSFNTTNLPIIYFLFAVIEAIQKRTLVLKEGSVMFDNFVF